MVVVGYHHRSVVGEARAPVSLNLLQSLKLEVWNENLSNRTKDTEIDEYTLSTAWNPTTLSFSATKTYASML